MSCRKGLSIFEIETTPSLVAKRHERALWCYRLGLLAMGCSRCIEAWKGSSMAVLCTMVFHAGCQHSLRRSVPQESRQRYCKDNKATLLMLLRCCDLRACDGTLLALALGIDLGSCGYALHVKHPGLLILRNIVVRTPLLEGYAVSNSNNARSHH